nr:MAG TPA: hypothetical protein [Caudoviricetes sp.]
MNPKVEFDISGLAENRYVCDGNIWNVSTLITHCKDQKYPVLNYH